MVICPDCKTEFNYDKKLGYCPNCGKFYEGNVTALDTKKAGDVLYKTEDIYQNSASLESKVNLDIYQNAASLESKVNADVYQNSASLESKVNLDIYQNVSQQKSDTDQNLNSRELYNNIDYKTDDVMYAPEYYNYLKEKYGVEDETKQRSIKIDANYYQNIKPGENPYTDSPYKDFYDTHLNRVNEGFNDPLYKAEKDRKARRDITRAAGICIIVLFLVITLFSCATKAFMREAYQGLFSVSDSYEK